MKNWFYYCFNLFKPIIYRFLVHIQVRLLKFFIWPLRDQYSSLDQSEKWGYFSLSDGMTSLACYWWRFYWSFCFLFRLVKKRSFSSTFESDRQTDRFINFQLYIIHRHPIYKSSCWDTLIEVNSGKYPINICTFLSESFDVIYEWSIVVLKCNDS